MFPRQGSTFSSSVISVLLSGSIFLTKTNLQAPLFVDDTLRWLERPSTNSQLVVIIRFIYQASKYSIWKERNARIHSSMSCPPEAIIMDIKDTIRLRLDPIARKKSSNQSTSS